MIRIENLYKQYHEHKVLRGINLHIHKGETFVILGQSGIGKSVLLRQIIGLEQPDDGSIFINNHDMTLVDDQTTKAIRAKIGLLFQEGALFDYMTVGENIILPMYEHNQLSKNEFAAKAREMLAMVHLNSDQMDLYPNELSGGMKKRVALARTLVMNPDIILYDEPTTGLDPIRTHAICDLIKLLQVRHHKTSVVVTHDLAIVEKLADTVAFLHEGKIIFQGSREAFAKNDSEIVRSFRQR